MGEGYLQVKNFGGRQKLVEMPYKVITLLISSRQSSKNEYGKNMLVFTLNLL